MRDLTALEQTKLKALTKQIHEYFKNGYEQYYKAGQYLKQVRDERLWEGHFDSFKDFFEKEFGQHRSRAYQLIETYEIARELPSSVSNAVRHGNEVLALKDVPKEDREEVVKETAATGKVTAARLRQTAASRSAPSEKPPTPLDATGTKIPPPALPYWERRNEVQAMLTELSEIKCKIHKALEDGDSLYAWIGNPAIDFLSSAYAAISNAKLYAVCTVCQGWGPQKGGCADCHNTGLISKHHYDVCSKREVKAIRERANLQR